MYAIRSYYEVTGGGQLINHDGDRTANFGFNADTCAGDIKDPRGHFNYNDQGNGVRMNGELKAAAECVSPAQWEGQWFAPACVICKAILGVPSYLVITSYSIHYTKLYDDPGVDVYFPRRLRWLL